MSVLDILGLKSGFQKTKSTLSQSPYQPQQQEQRR